MLDRMPPVDPNTPHDALIDRMRAGDRQALATLFDGYRGRLRTMLDLRMDRRLRGRVDSSDVLQEAFLASARKQESFGTTPTVSPYVWFRTIAAQCLVDAHRQHLGVAARDAGREASKGWDAALCAEPITLVAQLVGSLSSPSQHAMRAEMQCRLEAVLNQMSAADREILALRHFEELSNDETAQLLGLKKAATSNRYVRALGRLRAALESIPGFVV